MSNKIPEGMTEIKCGGGTLALDSGAYSYYIELHLLDSIFHFECMLEFETIDSAEARAMSCMASLPLILMECIKRSDMSLFDAFCEDWQIEKIPVQEELLLEKREGSGKSDKESDITLH